MKLTRFKVTNFRSVVDSGWVDVEQVTALIGVNESGKTNLLLPLWKLNPAREGEIKPTSDYPKAAFSEILASPGSYAFITAEFDCSELAANLAALTGLPKSVVDLVQVTRFYDGQYRIAFPKHAERQDIDEADIVDRLQGAVHELKRIAPLAREGTFRDELEAAILFEIDAFLGRGTIGSTDLRQSVSRLRQALPEKAAPSNSVVSRYWALVEDLEAVATKLEQPGPEGLEEVRELILGKLPHFVYYSNYGNLDSEIYLPHVVQNMKREDLGIREAAKVRTLRVLFSFVKLQPEQILELGRDIQEDEAGNAARLTEVFERKRTRTIMLNSAGAELTRRFREWWKQGDYTFEFQADGNHFRIWVSESSRPEKVELEDRSSGLQWFLSFYLVFLVESERSHQNAVLLLDEPGLSLHPIAQRNLSAFFENLSRTNQLIYTTHSPFLVDADMLDRARKVYVDEDGSTKASSDLRRGYEDPRRSGATYAIHSALNMSVAESLLLGCRPVIVEGPSHQHYLAMIKTLLIASRRIAPRRELVFAPSHGPRNARVVASILGGRDEVLPIMLLDGDEAGRRMAAELREGIYQNAKDRILLTDDFAGFDESEIEDLLPIDFLANIVDRRFRQADIPFSDVARGGSPIIPQITSWAADQEIVLAEGWKIDLAREAKRRALALGYSRFGDHVLDYWTRLFDAFEVD